MTRRRSVIVAAVLWLVLALVVWNVVFDRMVVLAGRRYSYDAVTLYRSTGRYLLIDQAMRPAVAHAVRVASAVGGAIVIASLFAIWGAAALDRRLDHHEATKKHEVHK